MRLIDADALKFKNVAEVNGILTHVLLPEEIDNAPTVVINDKSLEIARKSFNLGRRCYESPKGEWINRQHCQVDEDRYEVANCKNCGAEITIEYPYDNFCPNCGADMRPEEEEEENG